MRYTPYLDRIGVTFKDEVPDHAVNVIDSALSIIESTIDWGEYEGKKRKPCPENPVLLAGQPIGQYHCPVCGMMLLASLPHLSPAGRELPLEEFPVLEDYEVEYGRPWPPGYFTKEENA